MDCAELGVRLRALREKRGMTIEGAAKRAGMSSTQIIEIEGGHKASMVITILKIMEAWGISPRELFY